MKTNKIIAIILVWLFLAGAGFAEDCLKLHFIDIGEGDAILVQYKNNNTLIDTGNILSGYKLLDYLIKNEASEIKCLIITHPHPDHIGGVFFILPKLRVQEIYDNGQPLQGDNDMERQYNILVRSNKNYRTLKKAGRLRLKGINLDVLWPMPEYLSSSYNENSLVIKLNYNNFSCLFTGDLNRAGEEKLLKDKVNMRADILKVGHHGNMDATSGELLDAVLPEVAIISVGSGNKSRLPSSAVLELLKKRNIKIYRTDKDGNIIISVDKKGRYSIKTENK